MPGVLVSRQPGQTIVLVPIGLIAMFGMAALIVNIGLIFMLRSELQNAVDAAALAAAWYFPVCQEQTGPGGGPPHVCGSDFSSADSAARFYFNRNVPIASRLCDLSGNPNVLPGGNPQAVTTPPNFVIVYATCTAHMSFGGIFSVTALSVDASATAALCDAGVQNNTNPPLCTGPDLTSITSLTAPGSVATRLVE
jgi:hypothetical protein